MAVSDCIRMCRYCGVPISHKSALAVYCGRNCKCKAAHLRRLDCDGRSIGAGATQAREFPCSGCGTRLVRHGRQARPSVAKCAECVKAKERERWKRGRASASYRASNKKRKALRRMRQAQRAEAIDPIKVFERDKWRCHICKQKTLKSRRGSNDPRAPELDHIVTLADGGTHTWGNVACACRQCNGAKGGRSLGQLGLALAA